MKKQFLYLFGFLALMACTDDENVFVSQGIAEPGLVDESGVSGEVTGDVFTKLNLDYPGLEEVKKCYEAQDLSGAAAALLEYYRNTDVVNPNVNLVNPNPTEGEKRIAEQALEENGYRFRVATFTESGTYNTADAVYYSFKKDDGTIDWGMNPTSTKDQEFRYQQHRWQWMGPQAKTYRATRDERYVESWINVYNSWMKAFPCPKTEEGNYTKFDEPRIDDLDEKDAYQWKGLQPAERLQVMNDIWPYFIWSKSFTPALLTTFLNSFADHVEMVRTNYYAEGNILLTQAQSVVTAGILMPELGKAQEWINDGCNVINTQMNKQWLADGVHFELDPHYHISAISDFLSIVELSELAGESGVSTPLRSDIVESLKKSMLFAADIAYPDLTVDNWNDTRSVTWSTSWDDPVNKTGRHSGALQNRLKEYTEYFSGEEYDNLLWQAWEGSKGTAPSWKSKAYETSGWYMLRNWNKSSDSKAMMMVLKNNANVNNSWHCQSDNNTFGLWAGGRNFFPDAGVYSYNDGSADRNTYRNPMLHNVISFQDGAFPEGKGEEGKDDDYVQPRVGKFLTQVQKADYDAIVTEFTALYKGESNIKNGAAGGYSDKNDIIHRRTAFFVHGAETPFFVLLDEVCQGTATTDNISCKFNLNFHVCAEKGENNDLKVDQKKSEDIDSYYWGQLHTLFTDGNNLLVKAFSPKSTDDGTFTLETRKVADEVAVSNELGEPKDGGVKRNWFRINGRSQKGNASHVITILYPYNGTSVPSSAAEMKAEYIGQDELQNKAYPEKGHVKVTVDGKTYDLEYAL